MCATFNLLKHEPMRFCLLDRGPLDPFFGGRGKACLKDTLGPLSAVL